MPGHGKLPAMAEKDDDGPSLELPSLGFGRKRGRKDRDAPDTTPEEGPAEPPAEPAAAADPPPPPAPEADDRPTEPLSAVTPPSPQGKPLFADEAPTTRVDRPLAPSAQPAEHDEPPGPAEPARAKPRRPLALPSIGLMPASVVTGLLVGVLTVGATWGGLRLCEVVRGTSSCGNPGMLLLLVIVIAMVLVGSMLLRAWGVPDPGSTSFLGVGLLTVLVLLFLVDLLFHWWMIIVIPVVAMLTFALSHWVATAFVEPDR